MRGRFDKGAFGIPKPTASDRCRCLHLKLFCFELKTYVPLSTRALENEERKIVTAETLMQQVEELLLMNEFSEGEKAEILQNVLSILEEEK